MKNIIFWLASLTIVSAACSNSATEKKDSNISKVQPTVSAVDTLTKPSAVTGISIISIKEIVDNYLQIKNAFAKDNSANAATAAKEMAKAFTNFNKSALTAEQAKICKCFCHFFCCCCCICTVIFCKSIFYLQVIIYYFFY